MFRYTYAAIKTCRQKRGTDIGTGYAYIKGTVTKVSIEFAEKEGNKNKKVGISTKLNADHEIEEDIHT